MTCPRFFAHAALLAALLASAGAQALDFKTVNSAAAILYDAPSIKGGKLYIAPRGMPVEVVLTYGEWVKVRDVTGELAWTEARSLSPKRNVVVKAANAKVRAASDESAAPVLQADKGVLLELIEVQGGGWAKVRHRDGITGYVRTTDIWGV